MINLFIESQVSSARLTLVSGLEEWPVPCPSFRRDFRSARREVWNEISNLRAQNGFPPNADGSDVTSRQPRFSDRGSRRLQLRARDFIRAVLDRPRLRKNLLELLLRDGADRAIVIKYNSARAGRALIKRENSVHWKRRGEALTAQSASIILAPDTPASTIRPWSYPPAMRRPVATFRRCIDRS